MKDRVTLHIATHNITGKKYFGKTVRWFTQEDLQKNYHGSGKYWNQHKEKHGERDVTMEIYKICSLNESDDDYVKPIALKFSEENNIVKSDEWANLEIENGLNGSRKSVEDYNKIAEKGSMTKSTEEWKKTIGKQSAMKRLDTMSSEEWKVKNYDNMVEKRKINTHATINDPVWKETTGAEKSKKLKEIMKYDGARRVELQSITKNSEEWKNTTGKESIRKQQETRQSEEWFATVGYNQFSNHSKFMLSDDGKVVIAKGTATRNTKEWKESVGVESSLKQSITRNSEEWKNTIGKKQIEKFKETISKIDWKENVLVPTLKIRSEKVNSEEWLNTKGVEKLKNMEKHYLANCKHYDLYNYMTGNLVEHDITPRDFKRYSAALSKTSKEKYLGFTTKSKNKMIRDGKEQYIGLYIVPL